MPSTTANSVPEGLPSSGQAVQLPNPSETPEKMFERAFGGVWAIDPNACPATGMSSMTQPVTITAAGAKTRTRACKFTEKNGAANEWNLKAECSTGMKQWTSNVDLARNGNVLKWTNESGTTVYHRC